jgi:putative membrane protein
MKIKLCFVLRLVIYHFSCQNKMKQMAKGVYSWTSTQLRLWNELATVILFAIVFLVVLKNALNWIFGVVGIILLSIILMMAVKIYKRIREKT